MKKMEQVWPFLLPRLQAALKHDNRHLLDQFLGFASWVLLPRQGSRPGSSLKTLTGPVTEFITSHIGTLFEGKSREVFFRLQPGLKYHLSKEDLKVFDGFLEKTPKYVR